MIEQTTTDAALTAEGHTEPPTPALPTTRESAREQAAAHLHRASKIVEEMKGTDTGARLHAEVRIHALIGIATEWRYLAEAL